MTTPRLGQTTPSREELERRCKELEAALAAIQLGEHGACSKQHPGPYTVLRERDASLARLALAAPVGLGLVHHGIIREASPSFCRMVGWEQDELLGHSERVLYASDEEFHAVGSARARHIAEAGVGTLKTRFRRSDGASLHVWLTSALLDPKEPEKGLTLTVLDVTALSGAEEALRQAEQRYREIFNATSEAIFIDDARTGRMLEVNEAMLRMYGYSSEDEVLAGNIGDLSANVPPYTEEEAQRRIAAAVAGTPQQFEWLAKRRDGSVFPVEVTLRASTIGGQDRVLAVVRDITERQRAEAETRAQLWELERWYALMQRRETRVIALKNEVNELARRLGEPPRYRNVDEADPFPLDRSALPPPPQDGSGKLVGAKLASGAPPPGRVAATTLIQARRLLAEALESRHILLSILEDRERAERQREELEEQLRHAQKMEAIGALAGCVAHDFNNLLQAMMTQLDRARLKTDDLATITEVLAKVREQVRHGSSLTRQLLLFSRRETTTFQYFDLNQWAAEAVQLLDPLIRENISLAVHLSPDPLPVHADRGQLEQVLLNLVVNACQAMPEQGQLTIGTERRDAQTGALWVVDTGCGIPPELLGRIFEPFFTTKAGEKGTGLGLAVVHSIATRHGGHVEVRSEVGKGSTFRVLFPLCGDSDGPSRLPQEPPQTELVLGAGERILVIEDEDGAREGLREVLSLLGYQVACVASAAQALELPVAPPFRLLLTDLVLPDAHGADLARTLAERWPGIAVVLMSGYTEDEAVRRAAAADEVRFLQKPFDLSTLGRALRAALEAS